MKRRRRNVGIKRRRNRAGMKRRRRRAGVIEEMSLYTQSRRRANKEKKIWYKAKKKSWSKEKKKSWSWPGNQEELWTRQTPRCCLHKPLVQYKIFRPDLEQKQSGKGGGWSDEWFARRKTGLALLGFSLLGIYLLGLDLWGTSSTGPSYTGPSSIGTSYCILKLVLLWRSSSAGPIWLGQIFGTSWA